jgi:hypothetical protein
VKGVDTGKSVRETQVRHGKSDKGVSLSVQFQRRKEETVCSKRDRPSKVLLQQCAVAAKKDQAIAEDREQEGFFTQPYRAIQVIQCTRTARFCCSFVIFSQWAIFPVQELL